MAAAAAFEVIRMLCQKCHKNSATVRYAEVVNGKVNDLNLCQDCLKKQRESTVSGFELSAPAVSRTTPEARLDRSRLKAPRTCKSCGTRLVRALDTGKVGCSACYATFTADLESVIHTLHGGTHHAGKSPGMDDMRTRLREDLQSKRAVLRSAVQLENYEEAAALRDDIRQIETMLGTSSGHN